LKKVFVTFFICLACIPAIAVKKAPRPEPKNELGMSNAPVYFLKEKTITYGLHFHYVHNLPNKPFGIGLGFERIFDEHQHTTFGLVAAYEPRDNWTINVSPGVTMEQNDYKNLKLSSHFETSYEWAFKNISLGPAFEIAIDQEDYHVSLGLHLGYSF
jgi:hypothetical protein